MTPTVFLNNQFLPQDEAKISAFDHGFLYGDGVYETLLIEDNSVQDFESHYSRLQDSCRILGIVFPEYCDTQKKMTNICDAILIKNADLLTTTKGRGRLRITLSRGENNFDFSSCPSATVLISLSPLPHSSPEFFQKGVALETLQLERSYPEIKSTNFLASLLGRRKISGTDSYEGIFVTPEGFLREGTVSNVIAVDVKHQKIILAPEKTILPGTMQAFISQKFIAAGFTVAEKNFTANDIQKNAWELYITNSLFGIIPVRSLDNTILKSYTPHAQNFLAMKILKK